ncbi:arylamine N-acetyltransferase [Bacillus sp. JJ664]
MVIERYFEHIGIKKPISISFEALKEIHKYHLLTVPFENLDIINGEPLSMEPSFIMNKIIHHNRGGICFETNTLLATILLELGFDVQKVSAKFWNDEKQEWNPDFSHLALIVTIEGNMYLADVGVGGGFLEPILLEHNHEYSDSNGAYRVINITETTYILQKLEELIWKDLLFISTESKQIHQFEEQFLYYQTSNETIFTKNKIVNRLTKDGRITLSDHQLKITKNHIVTITEFDSEEEWHKIYSDIFQPSKSYKNV